MKICCPSSFLVVAKGEKTVWINGRGGVLGFGFDGLGRSSLETKRLPIIRGGGHFRAFFSKKTGFPKNSGVFLVLICMSNINTRSCKFGKNGPMFRDFL